MIEIRNLTPTGMEKYKNTVQKYLPVRSLTLTIVNISILGYQGKIKHQVDTWNFIVHVLFPVR
jgi:hypothetical protein